MTNKDLVKQALMEQIRYLCHEIDKCKYMCEHADEYDFYAVPQVEQKELNRTLQ